MTDIEEYLLTRSIFGSLIDGEFGGGFIRFDGSSLRLDGSFSVNELELMVKTLKEENKC